MWWRGKSKSFRYLTYLWYPFSAESIRVQVICLYIWTLDAVSFIYTLYNLPRNLWYLKGHDLNVCLSNAYFSLNHPSRYFKPRWDLWLTPLCYNLYPYSGNELDIVRQVGYFIIHCTKLYQSGHVPERNMLEWMHL